MTVNGVAQGCGTGGWYRGMGTGWVLGGAIPGYYPPSCKVPMRNVPAVRGQGVLGPSLGEYARRRGRLPGTTLRAGRCPWPLPVPGTLAYAASQPIRARFKVYLLKVSQNAEVSPEYVQKACHSPCSQTGSESHLLKFPDFRFREPSLTRN